MFALWPLETFDNGGWGNYKEKEAERRSCGSRRQRRRRRRKRAGGESELSLKAPVLCSASSEGCSVSSREEGTRFEWSVGEKAEPAALSSM